MAMTERALTYEVAQSYELRKMSVLDGSAVRARANIRRVESAKIAVGVAFALVYLLAMIFVEAQIFTRGTEINQLKAQIEDTYNEAAKADLVIGSLSSLERIESYAVTNLGMVYPAASDIYYLGEDSSLQIAQGLAVQSETVTAEMSDKEAPPSLWQDVGAMFNNWLFGTAQAAE